MSEKMATEKDMIAARFNLLQASVDEAMTRVDIFQVYLDHDGFGLVGTLDGAGILLSDIREILCSMRGVLKEGASETAA
jgi:hypothetical protein